MKLLLQLFSATGRQTIRWSICHGIRWSTSPKYPLFTAGFKPKGDNYDLFDHAKNNPPNSAYVSTSPDPAVAREFADEGGFVYTIKRPANAVDVNKTLGTTTPYPLENEIAVPGGVANSLILGAREVGPGGKFVGPFIKNPSAE